MKNRILAVDDEPKNLKILRLRLANNYELKEAESGEDALEVIKDFRPALVLLDIMMKGIDGYEVAKKIKQDPALVDTKIILISGKAMVEEKLMGYQAGADDYITKPFNGDELLAKVAVFMKLYNLETDLKTVNASLEEQILVRSQQLLKAERLASVGIHAAEIVHNLRNPLSIMVGYLGRLEQSHPGLEDLKGLRQASDKIRDIIKNILDSVSQDQKTQRTMIDLHEVLQTELEFLRIKPEYKDKIKVTVENRGGTLVHASRAHIGQILGNLIKNAAEAMQGSSVQHLKISIEDFERYVLLRIKDSGPGIPAEVMPKLFTPLFTTKDGKDGSPMGNGLGLAYCKTMVENYGGMLNIFSKPNEGAEVVVQFPYNSPKSPLAAEGVKSA